MPRRLAIRAISSIIFWSMAAKASLVVKRAVLARSNASSRPADPLFTVRHVRNEGLVSDTVLFEVRDAIGIATLNRPQALNALNTELLNSLAAQLEAWDRDAAIRCIIITGSQKAFAAGADVKEMA